MNGKVLAPVMFEFEVRGIFAGVHHVIILTPQSATDCMNQIISVPRYIFHHSRRAQCGVFPASDGKI